MTKEKMNELLMEVLTSYTDSDVAKDILNDVRKHGCCNGATPEYKLASVVLAIEDEINNAEAKKTGTSKKLKAIKDSLKMTSYDDLKCGYEYKDYQVFCNGYCLFALKDKIKYETKSEKELIIASRYNLIDSTINRCVEENTVPVMIPSISWIEKAVNKLKTTLPAKQKKDIVIMIDHKYLFSADKLIKCMSVVNSNVIMTSGGNKISHIIDDNGNIACIMPIYMKSSDASERGFSGKIIMIDNGQFSNDI